jgi:cell wall-associated NlpC family hydrolase
MRSLRPGVFSFVAAGVAVLVVPLAGAGVASADPVDDQRAKVEQYADMLEALEEETAKLAETYDIALDELAELEDDVAAAEEAVVEKQAEVAELQAQLGDVAVQAYVESGASGMGIFSEPAEFSEELQRDELTRVALNNGTANSDDLEQAVTELSEQQEALEQQREAAADKTEEVADAQQAAEEQTAELQQAQAEAEAELGELIREEQERRARESYERMQAEAAAAQARAEAQARAAAEAQQQPETASPRSAPTAGGGGGANPATGGGGGGGANPATGGGGGGGAAPRVPARPAPAPAPVPAASSRAGTAVAAALSQQGVSYKFAAASPGVAFDCSGLTSWAWSQAGVYLPHQSAQQYASIPHVPSSAAQPGDLIFYYSPISHVGMYIGGGQMVHATSPGNPVKVASVNWGNVTGVGRPS